MRCAGCRTSTRASLLAALPPLEALGALDSDTAWALLQGFGIGGRRRAARPQQAPLLARDRGAARARSPSACSPS